MWQSGFLWNDYWLTVTYGLYLLAAICWIPVVLIQIRMKGLLEQQSRGETFDAVAYAKLFRLWLRWVGPLSAVLRSEEHTSELQSLMRISYAVFCLKKKNNNSKYENTENNWISNA